MIEELRHPLPNGRRYFLSSVEPSGEFDAVIVAVTDGGRRRYFTTHDGERLSEVDEASFERRREEGARSLLELDERELGELEAELRFVRPVRGRDPIAEAAEIDASAAARPVEPEAETRAEEETDAPDDEGDEAAEVVHRRATFQEPDAHSTPATDVAEEPGAQPPAAADVRNAPAESTDVADADDDEELDPVTEEFEAMVMESTTVTSVSVDAAASVTNADVPPPQPATAHPAAAASADVAMPATEAIAQVSLAKGIAFTAHREQLDRSGAPYIDHPGRIAERFDPVTEPVEAAAAWLHDVLEDTAVTAQELFEAGVRPEVIDVVQLLTRTPEVTADEYYARIRRDTIARRVKLADIDDNTARWRLRRLEYETQLRLVEKYRVARKALGAD